MVGLSDWVCQLGVESFESSLRRLLRDDSLSVEREAFFCDLIVESDCGEFMNAFHSAAVRCRMF